MISILTKLLEDASENELHNYLIFYDKIENIKDDIDALTFESKESTYSKLMELVELYKTYFLFPEILNKNIYGIFCFDFKLKIKFYRDVLKMKETKFLRLFCNKLISPSENDNFMFLNYLDKKNYVTNKDIDFLIKNKEINLKEIINIFKINVSNSEYKEIVFFDMLVETFFSNALNLSEMESLIILSNDKNELKRILEFLSKNSFDGKIKVFSEVDMKDILEKYFLDIEFFDNLNYLKTSINPLNEKYNKIHDMIVQIELIFEKALLELQVIKEKLVSRKNNIEKMLMFENNSDLVNLSNEYKEKIEVTINSTTKLKKIYLEVMDFTNKLIKNSNSNLINPKLKYKKAKLLIKSNNKIELEKLILELTNQQYKKVIFIKYLNEGKNKKYHREILELNNLNDMELLFEQIKIVFYYSNDFNQLFVYLKQIHLMQLDEILDSEACEVIGDIFYKMKVKKSATFYRRGLDLGNVKCGLKLFNIYEENRELDERNLSYLSKNNVEEACVKLGNIYLKKNEYGKAVFEFKKGAILGSDECFYKLGEIHEKNKSLALFFYHQIVNKEKYWNDSVKSTITQYFYYNKDVEGLKDFYYDTKFPLAAFFLGKIYEKGEIVEKNETRALEFYSTSISLEQGLKNYQRLSNYITKKNNRTYSSRSSYSSSYRSHSRKSSSLCFITTAVCNTLGKPDNCLELNTFRNFRDNWLLFQSEGLSDIEEYYRIAPEIVSNINLLENRNEIYRIIWEKHLNHCFFLIRYKEFEKAWKVYKEMVLELSKDFFEE